MERTERQFVSGEITQVYVELTTHCNLNCRTCVRNSIEDFSPCHFTRHFMRRLIPMLKSLPALRRIVLLGFGEALCNPDFAFHMKELRKCGADMVMVSNAHFLDREISAFLASLPVNELWLSWDDDPRTAPHNRRGADAATFIEKAAMIREARSATGTGLPRLGMEIVAMKSNYKALSSIMKFGREAGIDRFILSNIFPYSESMNDEILYTIFEEPGINLVKLMGGKPGSSELRIARQQADVLRSCPFIKAGTVFITAHGDMAPCPELAYTHPAWYFGSRRLHRSCYFGSIKTANLSDSWQSRAFTDFRNKFEYFEFPDCSACSSPDLCWHRTVDNKDCYWNETPCGECLWAKGIVLCP
ncbi:MAG: hypothetical protein CVV44_21765 [Spirochaetae bacterium HGW-Spirochaetae-1]|jgi:MoaA/NifB/PqqE/SkfB family radical SAM enzyme|nr:MAG: hypothetical protein CVV44_21765 [Spirochaetae bacterium HGW-Spirochaetae-1]